MIRTSPLADSEAIGRVPTPSLVVDLAAVDRNIAAMASALSDAAGAKLRPHFKAHKCTKLMRRQVEAGACVGVTCATSHEAAALAAAGFTSILVANGVIDRIDLERLAAAARTSDITAVVDHPNHVTGLADVAASYGSHFGVLIDVDPGLGRTGVRFDDPTLADLARMISGVRNLRFRGIQAYEGQAVQQRDPDVRRTLSRQVQLILRQTIDMLGAAGFPCEIVSGGGTGTALDGAAAGVFTEIQAGSYVLMDTTYAEIGLPFEQALFGVASVISRRSPMTAAINAGTKALSVDKGMPRIMLDGARLVAMGDEHGRLAMLPATVLDVGDRVSLIPSHVDPTVNLHDVLHVATDTDIEIWPVDGRRTYTEGS